MAGLGLPSDVKMISSGNQMFNNNQQSPASAVSQMSDEELLRILGVTNDRQMTNTLSRAGLSNLGGGSSSYLGGSGNFLNKPKQN